jgi:hypothetical protein
MRQLQFHEYLALLDGKASTEPPSEAVSHAALEEAQLLWPHLKIGDWTDRERKVEYVAKCLATGTLLVHVSADWENSFLILVVPPGRVQADAYILFDIGAEYTEPRFICPAFEIDGVADESVVARKTESICRLGNR